MKLKSLVVLAGLAVPFAGVHAAESMPEDAMKLSEIVSELESKGYDKITEVSMDDGVWEVDVKKNDKKYELKVSPTDGKVLSEEEDRW